MERQVIIVGTGGVGSIKGIHRIKKEPAVIISMPPLPPLHLFNELEIGQKFKYNGYTFKKVSIFAAYRNRRGIQPFGAKTQVEKIIITI